jgi:hypothetical protein
VRIQGKKTRRQENDQTKECDLVEVLLLVGNLSQLLQSVALASLVFETATQIKVALHAGFRS